MRTKYKYKVIKAIRQDQGHILYQLKADLKNGKTSNMQVGINRLRKMYNEGRLIFVDKTLRHMLKNFKNSS